MYRRTEFSETRLEVTILHQGDDSADFEVLRHNVEFLVGCDVFGDLQAADGVEEIGVPGHSYSLVVPKPAYETILQRCIDKQ
jgi:hypothetical protein